MTIISWSQQIPTGPIHVVLFRQHQLQPVELNSRLIGSQCSQGSTTLQQDLWSELFGVEGASWEVLSRLCRQSRGTWDAHRQEQGLAPPHAHSQTSPWACSGKNCSGWAPDATLWSCNLCTLYCQAPHFHGGCASELITCDWTKYFMQ